MPSTITYRDHEISEGRGAWIYNFAYEHKDFDGDCDDRYSYRHTIQECKEAIDEWHLEQGENDE